MKQPPKQAHTQREDARNQFLAEIKTMVFKTNYLNLVLMA